MLRRIAVLASVIAGVLAGHSSVVLHYMLKVPMDQSQCTCTNDTDYTEFLERVIGNSFSCFGDGVDVTVTSFGHCTNETYTNKNDSLCANKQQCISQVYTVTSVFTRIKGFRSLCDKIRTFFSQFPNKTKYSNLPNSHTLPDWPNSLLTVNVASLNCTDPGCHGNKSCYSGPTSILNTTHAQAQFVSCDRQVPNKSMTFTCGASQGAWQSTTQGLEQMTTPSSLGQITTPSSLGRTSDLSIIAGVPAAHSSVVLHYMLKVPMDQSQCTCTNDTDYTEFLERVIGNNLSCFGDGVDVTVTSFGHCTNETYTNKNDSLCANKQQCISQVYTVTSVFTRIKESGSLCDKIRTLFYEFPTKTKYNNLPNSNTMPDWPNSLLTVNVASLSCTDPGCHGDKSCYSGPTSILNKTHTQSAQFVSCDRQVPNNSMTFTCGAWQLSSSQELRQMTTPSSLGQTSALSDTLASQTSTPPGMAINTRPIGTGTGQTTRIVSTGTGPTTTILGTGTGPNTTIVGTGTGPTTTILSTGTGPTTTIVSTGTGPTTTKLGTGTGPTTTVLSTETAQTTRIVGTGTGPTTTILGTGTGPTTTIVGTGTGPTTTIVSTGTGPTTTILGAGTGPTTTILSTGTGPTTTILGAGTGPTTTILSTGTGPTTTILGAGTGPTTTIVGAGTTGPTTTILGTGTGPTTTIVGTGTGPTTTILGTGTGPTTTIVVTGTTGPTTTILGTGSGPTTTIVGTGTTGPTTTILGTGTGQTTTIIGTGAGPTTTILSTETGQTTTMQSLGTDPTTTTLGTGAGSTTTTLGMVTEHTVKPLSKMTDQTSSQTSMTIGTGTGRYQTLFNTTPSIIGIMPESTDVTDSSSMATVVGAVLGSLLALLMLVMVAAAVRQHVRQRNRVGNYAELIGPAGLYTVYKTPLETAAKPKFLFR
ncbi:mucin-5AC-like [Mizuhopecten yessoensis]|uniref:mucin-5AC-like n=1 Tax=Mizuhopecten yessoensis TaxID=6573 RepID=UPI000B45EE84|nr:mucin-5AC-like [Mizuhopecten yessoensis]